MSFDKLALLAALQATTTTVDIDGLGPLNLRQISVAENDQLRASAKKSAAASDFGLRLVVASVVDDTGAPLLGIADLQALQAASGNRVNGLIEAVLMHNGYLKPAPAAAPAASPEPAAPAIDPDPAKNDPS